MIKHLALVIVAIVALVVVMAGFRPDTFRVERSTTMTAQPAAIFALINDFHNFGAWSPWEHLDPNMQRAITGAPSGKGAAYRGTALGRRGRGTWKSLSPFHRRES